MKKKAKEKEKEAADKAPAGKGKKDAKKGKKKWCLSQSISIIVFIIFDAISQHFFDTSL